MWIIYVLAVANHVLNSIVAFAYQNIFIDLRFSSDIWLSLALTGNLIHLVDDVI